MGELSYVPKTSVSPWNPNRSGLWNLLREGNGAGSHLLFAGPANLRTTPDNPPALLYAAGDPVISATSRGRGMGGLRRLLAKRRAAIRGDQGAAVILHRHFATWRGSWELRFSLSARAIRC